ncbi:MAG: hypothetical protein ACLR23_10775 [Clostridia bacterium]
MAPNNIEYPQSIAAFPGREAVAKGLDSTVFKNAAAARRVFRRASEYCAVDMVSLCYGKEKTRAVDDRWLGDPLLWDL